MKAFWIGTAGAAGALSRYLVGLWAAAAFPALFPWSTLLINLSGSFLLGLVAGLGAEREVIPEGWRAPISVGFIGAYTTFSTWTVDTVRLSESGHVPLAIANVVASLLLGLPVAWLGLSAGRRGMGAGAAKPERRS